MSLLDWSTMKQLNISSYIFCSILYFKYVFTSLLLPWKIKINIFFLQNKPAKRNLVRKIFTQEKKITIINSRTFLLRKTRIHILLTLNALEANAARSASVRSNSSKLLFSFSINKYFHCFLFCPFGQSVYILARTHKRSQNIRW